MKAPPIHQNTRTPVVSHAPSRPKPSKKAKRRASKGSEKAPSHKTSTKRKRSTGKENKRAAISRSKIPQPPIPLNKTAKTEWNRVLKSKEIDERNHIRLALYCTALARSIAAEKAIGNIAAQAPMSEGIMMKTKAGWIENPAVRTAAEAERHALDIAAELGLAGTGNTSEPPRIGLPSFKAPAAETGGGSKKQRGAGQ